MAAPGSWIGKVPVPKQVEKESQGDILTRLEKNVGLTTPQVEVSAVPPKAKKAKKEHDLHLVEFAYATHIECVCGEQFDDEVAGRKHIRKTSGPKKPFVLPEHLSDRPFAQNEALKALREQLPEAIKYNPQYKRPQEKN